MGFKNNPQESTYTFPLEKFPHDSNGSRWVSTPLSPGELHPLPPTAENEASFYYRVNSPDPDSNFSKGLITWLFFLVKKRKISTEKSSAYAHYFVSYFKRKKTCAERKWLSRHRKIRLQGNIKKTMVVKDSSWQKKTKTFLFGIFCSKRKPMEFIARKRIRGIIP